MASPELEAVQKAYAAMKQGTGTAEDYQEALERLNGPEIEGAKKYFILFGSSELVRLDGRTVVFTSQLGCKAFAGMARFSGDMGEVTKHKMLKQLSPDLDIVLDPGDSPISSPGEMMKLKDLPEF